MNQFEGAEQGAAPPPSGAGRIHSLHGGENHSGSGTELFDNTVPIQLDRGHQVFVVRFPTDEEFLAHRRQTEIHRKNDVTKTAGNARADRELVTAVCEYPNISGEDVRVIATMLIADSVEGSVKAGRYVGDLKLLGSFETRHTLRLPTPKGELEWETFFRTLPGASRRLLVEWERIAAFYDRLSIDVTGYLQGVPITNKINVAINLMNRLPKGNSNG